MGGLVQDAWKIDTSVGLPVTVPDDLLAYMCRNNFRHAFQQQIQTE